MPTFDEAPPDVHSSAMLDHLTDAQIDEAARYNAMLDTVTGAKGDARQLRGARRRTARRAIRRRLEATRGVLGGVDDNRRLARANGPSRSILGDSGGLPGGDETP